MPSQYRYSTDGLPAASRLASWNATCEKHCGAQVVNTPAAGFRGALTAFRADQLRISSFWSTPASCRNTLARGSSADDPSAFSLQLVHAGRCRIRHAGNDAVGVTGDMLLADGKQDYELEFSEPVHGLVISLPASRFSPHEDRLRARAGRLFNVHSGPGAVLASFIRIAWDQMTDDDSEEWPGSATEVIWDLLESQLLNELDPEIPVARPERIRRDARMLIDAHYRDPGFQSSAIASALGVSARYLQVAFAQVGTTPSRFLLKRRLEGVVEQLKRIERPLRITDVVLGCGFSDISYFSRTFHRHFGLSAREYRQRVLGRLLDHRIDTQGARHE